MPNTACGGRATWQSGEREADVEIAKGSGTVFRSTEDFIAHLKSAPAAEPD